MGNRLGRVSERKERVRGHILLETERARTREREGEDGEN